MARLIDANALIKEANKEGAYGYVDALQIANAPTIDAVEVVRCKDCKYHRTILKREMCAKNAIMLDGNEVGLRATSADFFCASGARMDGSE